MYAKTDVARHSMQTHPGQGGAVCSEAWAGVEHVLAAALRNVSLILVGVRLPDVDPHLERERLYYTYVVRRAFRRSAIHSLCKIA